MPALILVAPYVTVSLNVTVELEVKVFIIGTVYNLSNPVSDDAWMKFWEYYIYIHLVLSGIVLVWFTLGGFIDLKSMITSLQSEVRDHGDDGWVE